MNDKIFFGEETISIEAIVAIAQNEATAELSKNPPYVEKIQKGARFIDELLKEEGAVYGVTTGYGDSCTVSVSENLVHELPIHLTRFHNCGLGEDFSHDQVRAIQAVRLTSLSRGMSGVSYELLEAMTTQLKLDITPRIPQEGSVGASGDLTPLSYLAASLIGESEVHYKGQLRNSGEVYKELGMKPHKLRPKEALALMNGTAAMTAIACLTFKRAEYLCQLASRITSMASVALKGNAFHFDEKLFSVKSHPGQNQIATWIREDLRSEASPRNSDRLQDRYSIRCAPHIIGVLQDALPFFRQLIETELNSTNDNPIIDGEEGRVLHGGHFYGGHIAFVMDSMKTAIANVADLIDRQMALLMDTKYNNGLPANLSAASGERRSINHGFKAIQIGVSAWTAEALKQTMPASVFSRSTECHNQDKVSMGTIAARDCLRVLQLTEQVAAAGIVAVVQAIEIRKRDGDLASSEISLAHKAFSEEVLKDFDLLCEDRPMESTLRHFVGKIQEQGMGLYS